MLTTDNTVLMLVDYQGRLAEVMHNEKELHDNITKLVKGVNLLGVPVIWVEQYPKGLGETVENIQKLLRENNEPIAKMDFSACEHNEVQSLMEEYDRKNFILAGIEAHVCVYQTVKQLLQGKKHVEFIQDCISSRREENKEIAIEKMKMLGAQPTSVEMVLFELMGTAEHPNFREISSLIK